MKFLPGRAPNPVRGPQIIHSAHILPSRLAELRKSPTPDRPPLAPITIRDEMPMNFSGEHSAQRLRYEQAPKGRRSGASGWASDPADKEPLGWPFAPPIGRLRMAACPPIRRLQHPPRAHANAKRRPRRVAFRFWHRSEKPTEGNRG